MSVGTAEDAGRVLGEDTAGPVWLRHIPHALLNGFIAQRDRFALWIPVLFGAGIAVYFALTVEPAAWTGVESRSTPHC